MARAKDAAYTSAYRASCALAAWHGFDEADDPRIADVVYDTFGACECLTAEPVADLMAYIERGGAEAVRGCMLDLLHDAEGECDYMSAEACRMALETPCLGGAL